MQATGTSQSGRLLAFGIVVLLSMLVLAVGAALGSGKSGVLVLRVDGIIGPATADYIHRGLVRAAQSGDTLVVIEMDTPGGLDTSMRAIIKDILASPVPVATFVAPEGARAASAGTYILYASHLAAMAPATSLGAATPVAIGMGGADSGPSRPGGTDAPERETSEPLAGVGDKEAGPKTPSSVPPSQAGTMAAKTLEDATAYIRSLAQLRGRNVDFAVRAVREAASLSSEEALAAEVIDLLAVDLPALLTTIDGREVKLLNTTTVLHTAKAVVSRFDPDWRTRLLSALTNPQVALVLMMIGIYGLFYEFTSPGFGVPGVAGAISLLIALYAFQLLPVNWAGVLLMAIGAALMLAEAFVPSFGALGVGGIIAFVVGGLFLMDTEAPGFGVPLALIFGLAIASAAVILAIGGFAARSLKRRVVSGAEEMTGITGTVIGRSDDGHWWVALRGERWRAQSASLLQTGDLIRVEGLDGLTVVVSPAADTSTQRRST